MGEPGGERGRGVEREGGDAEIAEIAEISEIAAGVTDRPGARCPQAVT